MIETAVASSALIAVIIAIRFLTKGKISARLRYALWGLVLLRLLLPFPLWESPISVMNGVELGRDQSPAQTAAWNPQEEAAAEAKPPADASEPIGTAPAKTGAASTAPADWAQGVWIAGTLVTGLWFIGVNLTFYRKLRRNRRPFPAPDCPLPVYTVSSLPSPCLFGLFRPAIYLTPAAATNESRRHVITHELCHFAHGDHIWSLLRGFCLALHWFNPLVWAAAALSRADAELACDEAAIRRLGEDSRVDYGRTLVAMVAAKGSPAALVSAATTMNAGKRGMKERLNLILRGPKTWLPALFLVALLAAVAVGCTFSGAQEKPEAFPHDPSAADFLAVVAAERGAVEISAEMREAFNRFAQHYRWACLPEMVDGYESFFNTDGFAGFYGNPNFAEAVYYVLAYLRFPDRVSEDDMQAAIQAMFAAKNGYEDMPHQPYRKFAEYENGYYAPSPEGSLDYDRIFYLLTDLNIGAEEGGDLQITIQGRSYYFDTGEYEPGENELWLAEQAKNFGGDEEKAAAAAIAGGDMGTLQAHTAFTVTVIAAADGEPVFQILSLDSYPKFSGS